MINALQNGITRAIRAAYPDSHIYDRIVTQGIEPQTFLLTLVYPGTTKTLGRKQMRDITFAIQYFPAATDERRTEIHDVIDTLDSILETVTVTGDELDGSVTAKLLSADTAITGEDVLTYTARFRLLVYEPVTGTAMETVQTNITEQEE